VPHKAACLDKLTFVGPRPHSCPAFLVCTLDLDRIVATRLVAHVDFHESVSSTSDRALALAAEGGCPLPLLVLAERQTAGRGRGTNRWWSASGALTFSLALEAPPATLPASRRPQLALVAGLGVCEALASLAPRAPLALKWPNDVFLGGRKVCGILAETVPGTADRVVVGIGINVNNSVTGQSDLESLATALIDHDAIARDLTSVLTTVLDHFDRRWREFLAGGLAPLCDVYERYALLTGRFVEVELPGGARWSGWCRGIDEQGQLCVQSGNELRRIVAGTIQSWQRDL